MSHESLFRITSGTKRTRERNPLVSLLTRQAGACELCDTSHHPADPHNLSAAYQLWFLRMYDRVPNWLDAMAHCEPKTQKRWREELAKEFARQGLDVPPELGA